MILVPIRTDYTSYCLDSSEVYVALIQCKQDAHTTISSWFDTATLVRSPQMKLGIQRVQAYSLTFRVRVATPPQYGRNGTASLQVRRF